MHVQVLLACYSGQDDIVVGTPYAKRNMPELQQLAGCLVNTVALRCNVSRDSTFQSLLRDVSKSAMQAFSHADAPFAQVVQTVQQPRSASFTPIYQVRSLWFTCHCAGYAAVR